MSHPYHHSQSSAKRFGGEPDDYVAIHNWFDQTKASYANPKHRAILHSSFGIFLCEQQFGVTIPNEAGKQVPVRLIAEQHVREDLGRIPSIQDWLGNMPIERWMMKGVANADEEGVPTEDKITISFTRQQVQDYLDGRITTHAAVEKVFAEALYDHDRSVLGSKIALATNQL